MGIGVAFLVAVGLACGGGGNDETPDQIAQKAYQAVNQAGKVYHVRGDDGSDVWIDAANQRYRRGEATSDGVLTSVGDGWTMISYDRTQNQVTTEDTKPTGSAVPRINDPMAVWLEPLGALAYGQDVRVIGKTMSDGREVLALEVRSPIFTNNQPTGRVLVGRVELDPDSYLPVAFERRQESPPGQPTDTPSALGGQGSKRVKFTLSEMVAPDSLPADFFSRKVVEDEVVTVERSLQKARDLGLTPFWLGKEFKGSAVNLRFSSETGAVIADPATSEASIHYALQVVAGPAANGVSDETVVIKLAKADKASFGPPVIQDFAGDLPEQKRQVTAHGRPAPLFVSVLTPSALPCPKGSVCPRTNAPLYTRLDLTLGDTAVQIEAFARIDGDGNDLNPYNSIDGIIGLADVLTAAP